jgi:hypothetical protein
MNIDFSNLAVGTKLGNQFTGVGFLKYQSRVGGVVVDTPSGHVASFNDCPGCEFFSAGANIAFSTLQRTVTLHVGLLPIQGITVQRDLRLTAFDAGGAPRATAIANVTAGAGFDTAFTVTLATPQIASVVLDAINDPEQLALIAIHDIIYEDAPPGSIPDFVLDGPPGATLLQGAPPVDIPLVIRRIGGSTGAISFSFSPLPAGVSGSVLPNPASANGVALRLQAAIGPALEVKTVVVTGTPLGASAGPAPRTLAIDLATAPMLRVSGPADIDFACCTPSGARGSVIRDYVVIRDPSVSGPINVSLGGLPADVTGTVDPQTLEFLGGAIGERLSVSLTGIAGPIVPDTTLTLRLTAQGIDMSFSILLHGSCPQQNRNFVIRGQFLYVNEGDVQPLRGAQVEIFRYRSDWYDDRVDSTFTDDEGRFSRDLFASLDGDYYARLRLFSAEVQVEDADNSSVWSIDTQHQTNRGGLIEVGSIQISRDAGHGTPRAAVWQGFRNAALEFQQTCGRPVPGGFLNVVVFRGMITPLTFYDEVHWAHAYPSGTVFFPEQTAIRCYRAVSHEFGHVIRHLLDGSFFHWNDDSTLYLYGRSHGPCWTQPGTQANAGFAFNEGWAEYWSQDINCCQNGPDNEAMEGNVAHDLNRLSTCPGVGRKGMVHVLARGENLIHSDSEFRREYALQFPDCPLGQISDGCSRSATLIHEQMYPLLDPELQRQRLLAAIDAREKSIALFKEQQHSTTGLRTFVLRAAVEEGTLLVQRMREELVELDRGGPLQRYLQRAFHERRLRAEFVARRRAIQMAALRDALGVVSAEQRPAVERRIRLLQESRVEDASLDSMLSLPAVVGDDTVTASASDL